MSNSHGNLKSSYMMTRAGRHHIRGNSSSSVKMSNHKSNLKSSYMMTGKTRHHMRGNPTSQKLMKSSYMMTRTGRHHMRGNRENQRVRKSQLTRKALWLCYHRLRYKPCQSMILFYRTNPRTLLSCNRTSPRLTRLLQSQGNLKSL